MAVIDFTRTPRDIVTSPLHIKEVNPNDTTTLHNINTVTDYKYLGVIFDPKLNWRAHISKVTAKATKWTQQLWRLAKLTGGIPPGKTHQLYNAVVVPAFTYTSDVWFVPPFKLAHKRNTLGSISATKRLCSIQGQAAWFIMGGLRGTAFDMLGAHAYIAPVDLFHKTKTHATIHICALPTNHP